MEVKLDTSEPFIASIFVLGNIRGECLQVLSHFVNSYLRSVAIPVNGDTLYLIGVQLIEVITLSGHNGPAAGLEVDWGLIETTAEIVGDLSFGPVGAMGLVGPESFLAC